MDAASSSTFIYFNCMHHYFIAGIITLKMNYHKNERNLPCEAVMHIYKSVRL
ncbi:hypothetical protein E2C01_052296 [Portunus trituberculatus]|uniref:Uncharacterized protein n=1 Tax=Portunus trituberculatus TaxID=210409 RepID=A0A5B7GDA9_PORTR|nr:hypothetical protein [Portunus trituberculatus]